jgi:hypothetical protein
MSSTTLTGWWPGRCTRERRAATELFVRLTLAAIAVGLCYCFAWQHLRSFTLELNLRLDAVFGVYLQRISADAVVWRGVVYRYAVPCTMADVWCAAIPLVWSLRQRVTRNLAWLAVFAVELLLFNVARLTLSDVLVAAGASWNIGHNIVAGLAYYAIWELAVRPRILTWRTHESGAAK